MMTTETALEAAWAIRTLRDVCRGGNRLTPGEEQRIDSVVAALASAPAPVEGPCRHVDGCVECQAKYVPAAPVESAPGACTCGNPKGAHLLSCPAGPATWAAPASPPAEPAATCQEQVVKRTYHNAFGVHQDKGPCGLPMPCPTHQAVPPRPGSEWECGCGYFSFGPICTKCGRPAGSFPPFPPAEPGTCPYHNEKWIEGTACPKCGGRRFWHSGMGETTTDEHQKCIGPCGMDRFVDGIDS